MRPGRLLHSTGGSADCYGGGWRKVAVPRRGARVTGVSLPVGPAELRVCLACVAAYGAVLGGRPPCRCLCPFLSFLYAWLAVVASLLAAPSHTNYPRQSGAHFACAVRWRALLPFFVCLFYPSSAAYPFLCLCTSQGAITMAVFGSGMRNEYAFFGYEGDFVRCHFGRSDCVCRPRSWLAAGSTVWARRGAATNGEESAVVRGDDAERCSDATPGPRSAFGAGPELPPPGCVSVALSLAPPPCPLQAEAASLCFRTAITFGVLSALSAVTFVAAAVRDKGLAVSTPAAAVEAVNPSRGGGGGGASGYRPV